MRTGSGKCGPGPWGTAEADKVIVRLRSPSGVMLGSGASHVRHGGRSPGFLESREAL